MSIPAPPPVPALVTRATGIATATGFPLSCTPEVGRLLATAAATKPVGRIAESGTGCGVGTAWLHSGLGATATLVTVEREPQRASAAAELFRTDRRVTVLIGDWRRLADYAPFDVFFCDGGGKREDPDAVIDLLSPGGVLILDDFTPDAQWPPQHAGAVDELRLRYLADPRLVSVEARLGPDQAVLLCAKR